MPRSRLIGGRSVSREDPAEELGSGSGCPGYKRNRIGLSNTRRPAATVIELALLGVFRLYVSPDVIREYREILARDKFSRQQQRIDILLAGIEDVAVAVMPEHTISISPDAEDNRLLECASAVDADFLVTGNLKHFPKKLGETSIVSPREFLLKLGY